MKKEDTKLTPQEERIAENIAKGFVKRVDEIAAKRKEDGKCECNISKFSLAYDVLIAVSLVALITLEIANLIVFS